MHLRRKVEKDFVFSDGTFVPAGTTICVNSYGSHHDETLFPSPETFDGFRFVTEDSQEQTPMTKPTLEYNVFGYGKRAWYALSRSLYVIFFLHTDIFGTLVLVVSALRTA